MLADEISIGAFAALGALMVAIVGVPPTRRMRLRLIRVSVAFSLCYAIGALVGSWPVVAVVATAIIAAASIVVAATRPTLKVITSLGVVGLVLGMNVSPAEGVGLAAVFLAGGAWAVVVLWFWPVPPAVGAPPLPTAGDSSSVSRAVVVYAGLYSSAATIGLILGFATGFEHVGWIAGASVLIMRPDPELSLARAVGRAVATYIGVFVAALLEALGLGRLGFAVVVVGAVTLAVGTRLSRWYITAGFTGVVALLVIGVSGTGAFEVGLRERVIETTVGALLAVTFGCLLPRVLAPRAQAAAAMR